MKVALTVWQKRVSPVADSAQKVLIADIGNRKIQGREYAYFDDDSLFHRARKLADLDVKIFICGAISRFYASLVEGYGIRLIPFVRGEADEVLSAYLDASLSNRRFVMSGFLPDRAEKG
jgi:predicted Fe-Mo cluster-binding NifX family protein